MSGATVRSSFPMRRRVEVAEKRAAVGEAKAPSRLARMLALAHHVERLIDTGELTGYAEAARVLGHLAFRHLTGLNSRALDGGGTGLPGPSCPP